MTAQLFVLLGDHAVGRLTRDNAGSLTFEYDEAWLEDESAYPLSISMPLARARHSGDVVEAYLWASCRTSEVPTFSRALGVAVGRREDDGVAVRIAHPELAVVRVRISVHIEHDGRLELARTRDCRVEVVDLEPQEHAIADGARGVAHRPVVVIDVPRVQLQDETVRAPLARVELRIPEPLVLRSSVTADAAEESLVPAARYLNVAAVDEGLGAHVTAI
jgi:hypothetical protein